jgi:hypothetical protein
MDGSTSGVEQILELDNIIAIREAADDMLGVFLLIEGRS